MRKLFFFMMLLVGSLVFTSCEDSEEIATGVSSVQPGNISEADREALDALCASMREYNAQTFGADTTAIPSVLHAKSKQPWWKRALCWLATGFADAVGGVIGAAAGGVGGAVVGGAACSTAVGAYCLKGEADPHGSVTITLGAPAYPKSIATADSVGLKHNLILVGCLRDSASVHRLLAASNEQRVATAISIGKQLYVNGYTPSVADRALYAKTGETINSTIAQSTSFLDFGSRIKATDVADQKVLEVLLAYFEGLSSTEDDEAVGKYLQHMLVKVETAGLSRELCQNVKYGLEIGAASYLQWERFWK